MSSPLLRSAVVSLLAAGAGHVAGGTALGIMNGQNVSDAFSNSFKGMGTRMAVGRALGVATCYANGVLKHFFDDVHGHHWEWKLIK